MSQIRVFTTAGSSPMEARRFVLGLIPSLSVDVRDSVEVMVSELATNAQLHAATDFEVEVSYLDSRERLRVAVSDRGAGLPVLQRPSVSDPHGRGLQIVAMLSDSWGIDWAADEQGKTVWFELAATRAELSPGLVAGAGRHGAESSTPSRTPPNAPLFTRQNTPQAADFNNSLRWLSFRPARVRARLVRSRATSS